MRDREHAEPVLRRHRLDPASDVAQRIDVETTVDLVEDRELRFEHRELQRLRPLLLAARELDVEAPLEELRVDVLARGLGVQALPKDLRVGTSTVGGRSHQIAEAHAGKLDRVLHGEEQAPCRPLVRGEPEELFAVDGDAAAGDLVVVAAHQHVRQRGLARAVRPHQRVHLARRDLEIDPRRDLLPGHGGVEIGDPQHAHGTLTITSSPDTWTS